MLPDYLVSTRWQEFSSFTFARQILWLYADLNKGLSKEMEISRTVCRSGGSSPIPRDLSPRLSCVGRIESQICGAVREYVSCLPDSLIELPLRLLACRVAVFFVVRNRNPAPVNPKGIPASSPRLRGTSYLGFRNPKDHNPNGVASPCLSHRPKPRWSLIGSAWLTQGSYATLG